MLSSGFTTRKASRSQPVKLGFNLVARKSPLYIRRMQTALHIAALVTQLKTDAIGGRIVVTEFYKKLRTALFIVQKGHDRSALAFVYHPAGAGCFWVPASKIKLETAEKPWPIFGLEGPVIRDVVQPELDRIFELVVEKDNALSRILFEALGPNGNIWLLDEHGGRQATLRNRKFSAGEIYEPAETGDRLDPRDIKAAQLAERILPWGDRTPVVGLKNALLGFNETMSREALARAGLHSGEAADLKADQVEALAKSLRQIAAHFEPGHSGYLYDLRSGIEVYPFRLGTVDLEPEKFKNLSLAVMAMVDRRQVSISETSEEQRLFKAVAGAIKRQERLLKNIEADTDKAAGHESYKRIGELLQINRQRLRKGMKRIEVEDILSDPASTVTIELNPAVSPSENIDEYFRRHRKGREGLDLLRRRLEIVSAEMKSLLQMQHDLERDFESARQKYQAELISLLPRETQRREVQPRLPYREARLSTGLTIFIGRDGADNDRTTFDFARPYELWFHTQQCAGSHVVMKFPNKSFEPSKREIEETAAIAAWHSKARHDTLVPVAYTQRRYVRKPRNAKPGLVMVERERSVMVAPRKELPADR